MLVDSHCHLDFDVFDDDRAETIRRARDAGVGTLVTICTRVSQFEQIRAIAESDDNIWCSVGTHPHQAEEEARLAPEDLIERSHHAKVIGIGETGLDYYYDNSPRDLQREALARHLQLAQQCSLPIVLHCRDAHEDLRDVLEAEGVPAAGGVVHCFTGNYQEACWYLDHGLLLSFTGIISFRNAGELREVAARVPLDSMMLETDSPYLAPEPKRGKRNEPGYVVHVAAAMALARDCSLEEVARATTANAEKMFFS